MFYYNLIAVLVLFNCFCLSTNDMLCDESFLLEARKRVNAKYCKSEILGTEFGWNYDNETRRLDVAFGARLDDQGMAWLAWGLNPGKEPEMVGTRALIGIKQRNGSIVINTYNITAGTKRGCRLQPSRIDLNVSNLEFLYSQETKYYTIHATIVLPSEYNETSINHVWQVGELADDVQPRMHSKSLQNFDSTQTIDLKSGRIQSLRVHSRQRLRTAHGILNIVGWGTLLPTGVIIARYFRVFPIKWDKWWFRVHVSCQCAGWSLGTAGWIIGLWLGRASKHYYFPIHGDLGIIIFTFTTLQMFALRLKPDKKDNYRHYWNIYHHFLGYSLLATISVNIFRGIKILSADHHRWKWAYIGELIIFGCIVLVFEICTWKKFCSPEKPTVSETGNRQAAAPQSTCWKNFCSTGKTKDKAEKENRPSSAKTVPQSTTE